jgi:hypothetical protein
MHTFWAGHKQWWREVRRGGSRLGALCTVLTFLALLAVSGPHLVHHLIEQYPQHDDPHSHAGQAQQRPDCLVLFLIQHTPVAQGCTALLPALLLIAEPIIYAQPLQVCAMPQHVFQARAPPVALL